MITIYLYPPTSDLKPNQIFLFLYGVWCRDKLGPRVVINAITGIEEQIWEHHLTSISFKNEEDSTLFLLTWG